MLVFSLTIKLLLNWIISYFLSIANVFTLSNKISYLTELSSALSDERPIIVLVMTLILTIHQPNSWFPPPNIKNSII